MIIDAAAHARTGKAFCVPGGVAIHSTSSTGAVCTRHVAVGVQAAYDAVARVYDSRLGNELDEKPVDRALLTSLAELAAGGTIADVGCGPGHITRFLATLHAQVIGIDLSPEMIAIARERAPLLDFSVGSILQLPEIDGAWAAGVALYVISHLAAAERRRAFGEFFRTLRRGGWLLVAFHIDSPEFTSGQITHLTSWFGKPVTLDGYFLDPAEVKADLQNQGFDIAAQLERRPYPKIEYPSRRCYLLAQRP